MDYDFYTTGSYNSGGVLGAIAGMLIFVWIISIAVAVFSIIVMWKIFKKAGKEGWIAIIPLYNVYTLFEITLGKGWYWLLLLVSIIPVIGWLADAVIMILTMIKLSKAFGKDTGFTVGLVLLSMVFMAILAFDKSTYLGVPTKDGSNMQPAGPQQNQFQNVGNEPVSSTAAPQSDMSVPQNETQASGTTTNQFQYNATNPLENNETNYQQPVSEPTFNQAGNDNLSVIPPVSQQSNQIPPVVEQNQQAAFCTNCGASLPDGTIFCPNCGTPKTS